MDEQLDYYRVRASRSQLTSRLLNRYGSLAEAQHGLINWQSGWEAIWLAVWLAKDGQVFWQTDRLVDCSAVFQTGTLSAWFCFMIIASIVDVTVNIKGSYHDSGLEDEYILNMWLIINCLISLCVFGFPLEMWLCLFPCVKSTIHHCMSMLLTMYLTFPDTKTPTRLCISSSPTLLCVSSLNVAVFVTSATSACACVCVSVPHPAMCVCL